MPDCLKVILLLFCLLNSCQLQTSSTTAEPEVVGETVSLTLKTWKNYSIPLGILLDSFNIKPSDLIIKISKTEYELGIYSDTLLVKSYPVVFGGNPIDDKLRRGDRCTPEGRFKIRSKYHHDKWSRFIWIDYPNEDSWKKHKLAKEKGTIPKKADIGGEIGIHGVPEGYDEAIEYRQNWTLGCVSMKNKDVNEVYAYITNNAWIEISK